MGKRKASGLISRAAMKKIATSAAKRVVKKHNVDPKAHSNMK
jgi:hypothetical protein